MRILAGQRVLARNLCQNSTSGILYNTWARTVKTSWSTRFANHQLQPTTLSRRWYSLNVGITNAAEMEGTLDMRNPTDGSWTPSMSKDISPPPLKRRKTAPVISSTSSKETNFDSPSPEPDARIYEGFPTAPPTRPPIHTSPFLLTTIRDLPQSANEGAVSLKQLIGDPLVTKLWCINYLIDVDFVYENLHPDVRDVAEVYFLHGSWRDNDSNKDRISRGAKKYPNAHVRLIWIHQLNGIQHSKIFIVERADQTMEVIIHTANLIAHDWTNMTNAVWRSYPLSKLPSFTRDSRNVGYAFKARLVDYLLQIRTKGILDSILPYDFTPVLAQFVSTVPTPRNNYPSFNKPSRYPQGCASLEYALRTVPPLDPSLPSRIVLQSTSFPRHPRDWLSKFLSLFTTNLPSNPSHPNPQFHIIWPTPAEIRASLNGYISGTSIHLPRFKNYKNAITLRMKKLFPFLSHWTSSLPIPTVPPSEHPSEIKRALRGCAAPHVKTYIKFVADPSSPPLPVAPVRKKTPKIPTKPTFTRRGDVPNKKEEPIGLPNQIQPSKYSPLSGRVEDYRNVEFALLTSANISAQAWGNPEKELAHNFEAGVLIYPALFAPVQDSEEEGSPECKRSKKAKSPPLSPPLKQRWNLRAVYNATEERECAELERTTAVRIPYDVPLRKYHSKQEPWSAKVKHEEVDVWGQTWEVEEKKRRKDGGVDAGESGREGSSGESESTEEEDEYDDDDDDDDDCVPLIVRTREVERSN